MDKPPYRDKVSSIEGVLVLYVEAFLRIILHFLLKVIRTELGVSLKIMFDFDNLLSSFE